MNNRFPTCNPPVASCDPPDPISEEESFDWSDDNNNEDNNNEDNNNF
jgi:hypothetical protein